MSTGGTRPVGGSAIPATPASQGPAGAVVTGGAGGLGSAIGARLIRRGLRVWLADLDGDAARHAADELGGGAVGVDLDVTDRDGVEGLATEVGGTAGLAVWVNNAGILRTGPSWSHPDAEQQAMFDVNVHGTIHGTLAALRVMRPAGAGHVVNIVSLAGLIAPPGETMYAATKHAALAFTLGTALDLREQGIRGIAVSAVCPDGVWSPMLYDLVDDPTAAFSFHGTMLDPDQVAARVDRVLDRRPPLLSVPRWRGGLARAYALLPSLTQRVAPYVLAAARRKQARFAASPRASDRRARSEGTRAP
jgi:NAD(P)-dependent dehydrogenase (short-subunit alcohol dehydrogenase family)